MRWGSGRAASSKRLKNAMSLSYVHLRQAFRPCSGWALGRFWRIVPVQGFQALPRTCRWQPGAIEKSAHNSRTWHFSRVFVARRRKTRGLCVLRAFGGGASSAVVDGCIQRARLSFLAVNLRRCRSSPCACATRADTIVPMRQGATAARCGGPEGEAKERAHDGSAEEHGLVLGVGQPRACRGDREGSERVARQRQA